ncbi:unnamed protein product [Prunus brigantina]
MEVAHWFVLNNCDEIMAYLDEHEEMMKREHPSHLYATKHRELFPQWFLETVNKLKSSNSPTYSEELYNLAFGPIWAELFSGCHIVYLDDPKAGSGWKVVQQMDQRNVYAIPELDLTDNDVPDQRLESSMENDAETLRDTNMSNLIRSRKAMSTAQSSPPPSQPSAATAPAEMDHLPVGPRLKTAKVTRVTNSRINSEYDERHRAAPTAELHSSLAHDIGHVVQTHCPMQWKSWKVIPDEIKMEVRGQLSIDVFGDVYVRPRNELAESIHMTMVERSQLVLQESASQLPPDTPLESVHPPQDAGFQILTEILDQTLARRPGTYC